MQTLDDFRTHKPAFALRAVSLAALLTLAGCGGGDDTSYAIPAPPAGLGTEVIDVTARAATGMPASRTDVPKYREDATAYNSGRHDATAAGNNACYADHTTNSTIRLLSGYLDIWEPSERKMNGFKASDYAGIFTAGSTTPDTNTAGKEGCDAFALTTWNGVWHVLTANNTNGTPGQAPTAGTIGTVKNSALFRQNMEYSSKLTTQTTYTEAQKQDIRLDDTGHKVTRMIKGGALGPLGQAWDDLAKNPTTGWGDTNASTNPAFGAVLQFVDNATVGNIASDNGPKAFYKFARPYRWSAADSSLPEVRVLPELLVRRAAGNTATAAQTSAQQDSDFPSGHSAEFVRYSMAIAYVAPQRFHEALARGLEAGENRIRAGMHSALGVMGGRMLGSSVWMPFLKGAGDRALTYTEAQRLAVFQQAQQQLRTKLGVATGVQLWDAAHSASVSDDRFSDFAAAKADYLRRLTYGFAKDSSKAGKPAVVPKGMETLLETRFPYLSADQRRAVLKTTAIDSGYPVLDDEEGFGRLNLFDAASGYGKLEADVTVTMNDSSEGFCVSGFCSFDRWRNDIGGAGKLTKRGSGTLALTGANTYSGGTIVAAGTLRADSATAMGTGAVYVDGGTLATHGTQVNVGGTYTQRSGTLTLALSSSTAGTLVVTDHAALAGALKVTFTKGYTPKAGDKIVVITAKGVHNKFDTVAVDGFAKSEVSYGAASVTITLAS
ncbi:autotransporter-associated beta strand repeat-containing protein [Paucibacter sp. PLA-PC-4]|uniref:autotransporter-associated beta strand repeat-containing protein n=1 Tax=Paucibacter sp. PLA-PC-4 TaxID=2993655 RepID=UPI002B052017|nr:autotransporter-associated beta strand repeat-containing protein [Paucibacter sp. PLA-PC-4]